MSPVSVDDKDSLVLVYFLSGALAFITILSVLLAFLLYIKTTTNNSQNRGKRYRFYRHDRITERDIVESQIYTVFQNLKQDPPRQTQRYFLSQIDFCRIHFHFCSVTYCDSLIWISLLGLHK